MTNMDVNANQHRCTMKERIYMYKVIFIVILMLCSSSVTYAETSQQRYIQRIKDEIAHNHRMSELELQYKIYCKELELQKQEIDINNANRNVVIMSNKNLK